MSYEQQGQNLTDSQNILRLKDPQGSDATLRLPIEALNPQPWCYQQQVTNLPVTNCFAHIDTWSTEAQEVILPNPNGVWTSQGMVKECM